MILSCNPTRVNDSRHDIVFFIPVGEALPWIVAVGVLLLDLPFHSHSATPPLSPTSPAMSFGALRSNPIISIRLDFPEPFGPISTLRSPSSITGESSPNESKLRICKLFNVFFFMALVGIVRVRATARKAVSCPMPSFTSPSNLPNGFWKMTHRPDTVAKSPSHQQPPRKSGLRK